MLLEHDDIQYMHFVFALGYFILYVSYFIAHGCELLPEPNDDDCYII